MLWSTERTGISTSVVCINYHQKRLVSRCESAEPLLLIRRNLRKHLLLFVHRLLCVYSGQVRMLSFSSMQERTFKSHILFFFRIDISQFSLSSFFSSTNETKYGTMSFRSLICLLIYSTTIILNLLAGSVDERLYLSSKYTISGNQTLIDENEIKELVSKRRTRKSHYSASAIVFKNS